MGLVPSKYLRTSTISHLSITTTATKASLQLPKKPLNNGQFFQRLAKSSRTVMTFDSVGALMINRGNRILIEFYLYCAVSKNCSDTSGEECEPCSFCHVIILIQNIIQVFFVYFISTYLLYDWITIMRYNKHDLSSINKLYSPQKMFVILYPYLSTTVSFSLPQGGRCLFRFFVFVFVSNQIFPLRLFSFILTAGPLPLREVFAKNVFLVMLI